MNANQIVAGLEYAFYGYPGRNRAYYPHARRVRVMHVYKLERLALHSHGQEFSRRKATLVECMLLDEETGQPLTDRDILTVAARMIVSTWDEHVVEKERYEEDHRQETERRQKADDERRRAIEVERAERLLQEQRLVNYVCRKLDINNARDVRVTFNHITINRRVLEEVVRNDGEGIDAETDQESINH